ncbi:MAG: hypothetical protein KF724_11500 [Phycisphaeraceae bacterium]|nr:hypothetical protein [Phycisphaeraceae bacterium]
MSPLIVSCLLSVLLSPAAVDDTPSSAPGYLVMLERSAEAELRPAAERLAGLHQAPVELFDPGDLDALQARLRREPPEHVAFVMRPSSIDMQFSQDLLERLVALDDDPFLDVRFAFITGRDGAAAERFVEAIEAARRRPASRKALMFGTWEGASLPPQSPLSALAMQGFDARAEFVLASDPEERRLARTRETLTSAKDLDLLLLFSHGHPDRFEGCFTGAQFREWGVRLPGAVVVNCACWNGAPGRWWSLSPRGYAEQPPTPTGESVALAILESGAAAYISGLDPWHGPLASRMTMHLLDGGLSLGAAQKAMIDRLVLEFAPEPLRLTPVAERRRVGEGREHRRRQAAAMIVFGDPAWAPFADAAPQRLRALLLRDQGPSNSLTRVRFVGRPLLRGAPGEDFMLAQARYLDYHSARSDQVMMQLRLEVAGSVEWPHPLPDDVQMRIIEATSGHSKIAALPPECVVEHDRGERRLQVRVPLGVRAFGTPLSMAPMTDGVNIVLELIEPLPPVPRAVPAEDNLKPQGDEG